MANKNSYCTLAFLRATRLDGPRLNGPYLRKRSSRPRARSHSGVHGPSEFPNYRSGTMNDGLFVPGHTSNDFPSATYLLAR
jgi:hypothetical protein